VTIALLVRPRGNRGELAAEPLSSRLERYGLLKEVFLFGPEGPLNECRPFEIESVWQHRGRVIFKFRGVDSISDAERLRGVEVRIPLASRLELEPDEYYQSDLVGCEVIDSDTGESLGCVTEWQECGGSGLLRVQGSQAPEILIPFARLICVNIDVKARRILVKLPDGLRELNRP
jgi:16S rRNA processing protein RimM